MPGLFSRTTIFDRIISAWRDDNARGSGVARVVRTFAASMTMDFYVGENEERVPMQIPPPSSGGNSSARNLGVGLF